MFNFGIKNATLDRSFLVLLRLDNSLMLGHHLRKLINERINTIFLNELSVESRHFQHELSLTQLFSLKISGGCGSLRNLISHPHLKREILPMLLQNQVHFLDAGPCLVLNSLGVPC